METSATLRSSPYKKLHKVMSTQNWEVKLFLGLTQQRKDNEYSSVALGYSPRSNLILINIKNVKTDVKSH